MSMNHHLYYRIIVSNTTFIFYNKANEKTRISFECKQNDKKYTMISKTKDFEFSAETIFKNEIIHFFNINANESTLHIYLEIEGKRIKSDNSDKFCHIMHLKGIGHHNVKKEMDFLIIEDVELKIVIRIINKHKKLYSKRSKSFYHIEEKEKEPNDMKKSVQALIIEPGMSIQDKIKLFSGELIKREINNNNKVIPGKLIIPQLFLQGNDKKKK
jgi:hypothetical protein